MKRHRIAIMGLLLSYPITALAKDTVPANVTVRGNGILDKVDWSFVPAKTIEFSKLKRCVATNLQNDQIQLQDSAGSWVGPATGKYYRNNNQSAVAAQSVFKFVDEQAKALVAQGWIDKLVFGFRWIIRYDLELAIEGDGVKMVMRNVKLAMSNTGALSNDGFNDLRTSYRFNQNYASLKDAADRMKSCIVE